MRTACLGGALAAAVLAGCAGTPRPNAAAELEAARRNVEQTAADPTVTRHAATEAAQARAALQRAEVAWRDRDAREAVHLTYLASRRADLARQVAEARAADDAARLASAERDKLVAEQRERDARRQASVAQSQAAAARNQVEAARSQAEAQADRAAELQRRLRQLEAQRTARGMVLTLPDVLFASGSATLQPGGERAVAGIVEVLRNFPEQRIRVEGHTDSVGDDATNQRLSQQRAEAFAIALIQAGAEPSRIEAQGLGESVPVADNDSPAGRQRNRRVEVVFSGA